MELPLGSAVAGKWDRPPCRIELIDIGGGEGWRKSHASSTSTNGVRSRPKTAVLKEVLNVSCDSELKWPCSQDVVVQDFAGIFTTRLTCRDAVEIEVILCIGLFGISCSLQDDEG